MPSALTSVLAVALVACGEPSAVDPDEELSAGPFTVFESGPNAFGHPMPDLDDDLERAFFRGRALFRDAWVVAPASTQTRDGLGPLFNARSCEACHVADGRGHPPLDGDGELGPMLLRLSVGDGPDPTYGGQLQPFASPGVPPEGRALVAYDEMPGTFADGTPYSLRTPRYTIEELGYGPLDPAVVISPRVAPVMIGLGLLAAIDDATLAEREDPDDRDGDGISGRRGAGRFGWTASQPTVFDQTTAAFVGDLGLTSARFPADDCTPAQVECRDAISGGAPEVIAAIENDVTAYSELLAVPVRRDVDAPSVRAGKALFDAAGCASCHVPALDTGTAGRALFAGVTIRPFTDLLLHDLGDGEVRTPPLWGLGLLETVNGHTLLLHDGRARGPAEAILWHGGEATAARDFFLHLDEADRDDLLAFLHSL